MVVTNRIFHIISIFFLVIGVILSGVGITLIIVSSTTQCTPVETAATVPACTVPPSDCPLQTCHSTMFGAQVIVQGDMYDWDDDYADPSTTKFQTLADNVSKMIKDALEATTSGKLMFISSDVTYDVQVTRFTPDDKGPGTKAYTSGVAISTGDDVPTLSQIRDQMKNTLGETLGEDSVAVDEPSHETCPVCTDIPIVTTTDCPAVSPSDCPSPDCSLCPTEVTTECPSFSSSTSTPITCPNMTTTECPTIIPTECPLIPCPTSSPTTCPPAECPIPTECPTISTTECPTVIPTDCPACTTICPVEITTECPSHLNTTPSDCPTVIPTDCPVCIDCPLLTCPTDSPVTVSECPTPAIDCINCPCEYSTALPSSCPSLPSECPTVTECPDVSTTECPTAMASDCPVCPTSPSTDAPSATECPTIIPTDCPVRECTECPSEGTTCPICPSTEWPSPTDSMSTSSPECPQQTCHSTMFGAQLSLVAPWDSILENTTSNEFKELADTTSEMIISALEGSSRVMGILASTDGKVTYDVQVSRFIADERGVNTIAFASGVALSTQIEEIPTVDQIRNKMDANLEEDSVTVKDNELQFCPYLPPPHYTTVSPSASSEVSDNTQSTVPLHTTANYESTQWTTVVTQFTTQEPETTQPSTPTLQSTTREAQSTTPLLQTTTDEQQSSESSTVPVFTSTEQVTRPSTPSFPQSPTQEQGTSQSSTLLTHSTTEEQDITTSSTPIPQSTSLETETTSAFAQSTTEYQENTKSTTQVAQSTSLEPDTTYSTHEGSQSTTQQQDITSSTHLVQSTTEEIEQTQSTTPLLPTTTEEQDILSSSTQGVQSTSQLTTQFTPAVSQSTVHDITTDSSSPTPQDQSTTEISASSTTLEKQLTTDDSTASTPSLPSTVAISSTETQSESPTTIALDSSTSEGPVHSTTPSEEPSTEYATTPTVASSTPHSQSTTEQQTTLLTTESFSTLLSTTEGWSSPSTVSCSGKNVINGDVYLMFDYTFYDGTIDETLGIESFITDTLFSFDGNDYSFDKDANTGVIPLRLFLVHYPADDYSTFITTPISSLDHLSNIIKQTINETPPSSDSDMKDALDAIFTSTPKYAPSIILISKSDQFVADSVDIATKLMSEKHFNIIGVPLNKVDLTRLTNHADLPLDVTSIDSQLDTATQIDSILMSISSYCLTSLPTVSTSRYTTPSTTKVPTTASSCASSLAAQSIAFVYQANAAAPTLNSGIVIELLNRPEVLCTGDSSFGALFPFPNTDSYPPTAAHAWLQLNDPRWPVFFNVLFPQPSATSANIADGLQSLIQYPGPSHQIVVIIANSDDDVSSAVDLADQLKGSSTIITLSYGGEFDLSPLASSPQFTLTQSTEDSTQAATLLLNSILQSTCQ